MGRFAHVLLPQPRVVRLGNPTESATEPVFIHDASLPAQGYRITIGKDTVRVENRDEAGAFYARATLTQLRRVHDDTLPTGVIEDWPDLPVRGVMLDISRDKVPSLATLRSLIDRLASWKINQVQLYMEHTFAYADHQEVWEHASPVTAEEIRELSAFCAERFVELVPNQNCLGHMERWLRHDRYRPLAITPDGWVDRRGRTRPPTTLDPDKPESFELVAGLLEELIGAFPQSRRVHVGLDEPWELADERFPEYLDWFRRVRSVPALEGRDMLVWGDIVARHPGVLGDIPSGITVCEWGYEATSPFAARAAALHDAGVPFLVCPGTSSWNSLVGRVSNAIVNCRAAAEAAASYGASGILVTDWGDNGHLQYPSVSDPGFATSAAFSWCLDANVGLDVAAALSAHAYEDESGDFAAAVLGLGDAHRLVEPQVANASVLVRHLYSPHAPLLDGLTVDDLGRVAETIAAAGGRARRSQPSDSVVVDELLNACALLSILVDDLTARLRGGGTVESVPQAVRRDLAARLDRVIETHRSLWLARNRPGGLEDSVARLTRLQAAYRE